MVAFMHIRIHHVGRAPPLLLISPLYLALATCCTRGKPRHSPCEPRVPRKALPATRPRVTPEGSTPSRSPPISASINSRSLCPADSLACSRFCLVVRVAPIAKVTRRLMAAFSAASSIQRRLLVLALAAMLMSSAQAGRWAAACCLNMPHNNCSNPLNSPPSSHSPNSYYTWWCRASYMTGGGAPAPVVPYRPFVGAPAPAPGGYALPPAYAPAVYGSRRRNLLGIAQTSFPGAPTPPTLPPTIAIEAVWLAYRPLPYSAPAPAPGGYAPGGYALPPAYAPAHHTWH